MTNHRIALFLATLTLMSASTASAVLPPEAYQEARDTASYHVLIRVAKVSLPGTTPGDCRVSGSVETILRKVDDKLQPGTELTLTVACRRTGDEIPDGGTLWTDIAALKRASVIEAYIDPHGDQYAIARHQVSIKESSGEVAASGGSRNTLFYVVGIAGAALVLGVALFLLVRRRRHA